MLYDGIRLLQGTDLENLLVPRGTSFPLTPTAGELFFRTDQTQLYVYSGATWVQSGGEIDFSGLNVKAAARAATTGAITLSGAQTIDGVAVVAGDRVLVKNQGTPSQNGVYVVAAGAWTRTTDFDGSPANEVKAGDFVFVTEGSVNGDTGWVLTTNGEITIGTTSLTFAQFTGGASTVGDLEGGEVGEIAFQSAPNETTFSNLLKFEADSNTLRLGSVGSTVSIIPNIFGSGTGNGASLEMRGGTSGTTGGTGGLLFITGGSSQASGSTGGNLVLSSGVCTHPTTGSGGAVIFQTGSFNEIRTERLRILNTGALSFGASGTAYGTSGQVLTSNGNAVPTWQSIPVTPAQIAGGAADQIPFQSAPDTTTFSNALKFESSTNTLRLGVAATPGVLIPNIVGSGSGVGASLQVQGGSAGVTGGAGGVLTISGGSSQAIGTTGGNLVLSSGVCTHPTAGSGGAVIFQTGSFNNVRTERFRILSNGAWSVGSVGTNTGTSGQVLTSNGSGSAPSWQDNAPTRVPRDTSFSQSLADRGKRIVISAGVTLPASVYSGGDAFSFYNSSASPITITQGSGLTLRQDGTANTGNRTLAAYGTCFVWYNTASEAVISGSIT